MQQLCFMAAEELLKPGGCYRYVGFIASLDVTLEAGEDTITIRGEDAGEATFARDELLRALDACGRRYVDWLARLGDRPDDLAQLRRHAAAAADRLRQAGLS